MSIWDRTECWHISSPVKWYLYYAGMLKMRVWKQPQLVFLLPACDFQDNVNLSSDFFSPFLLTLIWQINQLSLNLFPLVLGLKASVSTLIHLALPCKTIKEHCLDSAKRIAVSWGSVRVKLNPRWRVNPTPFLMLMNDLFSPLCGSVFLASLQDLQRINLLIRIGAQSVGSHNKPKNKTEEWLYSVLPFLSATAQYTVLSEICKMPNLDSVCWSGREKHRR